MTTLVQNNSAEAFSGTTTTVDIGAAPTVGNLVVCYIFYYSGGASGTTISSVTDSNAKAYTVTPASPTPHSISTGQWFIAYRICDGTESDSITVTFNDTINLSSMRCAEFNPGTGNEFSFDTDDKATSTSATVDAPTLTPAETGSLMVGAQDSAGGAPSINAPWTSAGTNYGNAQFYDLSVDGAQAADVDLSGSVLWHCIMACFTVAASGGAGGLLVGGILVNGLLARGLSG